MKWMGIITFLIASSAILYFKSLKDTKVIRYIPVGDSYTIGEGIPKEESFPSQLTRRLKDHGIKIELIANPAQTGWTTQDALNLEMEPFQKGKPTFSTLLIGVNDWVQGVDEKVFRQNLVLLIEKMQKTLPNKNNLILVTIPDFSATPTGKQYGNGRDITKGITAFNTIIKEEGKKRNLPVVDIFPISQKAATHPDLIINDGLHPSSKQYIEWVDLIYPTVLELFSKKKN